MEQTTQKPDQQDSLIDRLEALLETQIGMTRKSDFGGVETAMDQTHLIITEIAKKDLFRQPQFKGRRQDIMKLYQKLELLVSAGKYSVEKQLNKVGKGKKTMQAYRHGS